MKVIEITTLDVKYKRFEHLDGPTRSVLLAEVFAISYENGTREVINPLTAPSGEQTTNQTQQASQPIKQQTTTNHSQGAALGVNALCGYAYNSNFVDGGLGAKFSYTFPVPFRLAWEFDILWGLTGDGLGATRWLDAGMYGQYLLGKGNIATYPLVGIGYAGLNLRDRLGYGVSVTSNNFAVTLGWGLEGCFKNSNLFYSIEQRVKIVWIVHWARYARSS